ncbi:MAG: pyridoxal phosphate-dependent aminotransferase [Rhizobiaceae bacterium]
MTLTRPLLTPLAASLPSAVPFVGPETLERQRGRPFAARIGANESGFGPSPAVIAAMQAAAADSWKYGDPENHDLKHALAAHLRVPFDAVNVGSGIDGLLGLAVRLYVSPGDAVVSSLGAYPTFHFHVAGFGARLVTVPYRDDCEDLDALLNTAQREKPKLVYLANPDNPMGTWHTGEKVAAFAKALPAETMLILDEAYCETAPEGTVPDIDVNTPNVMRFRTLSKAYGMAGVRVGAVFGPADAIGAFNKVRNHFGIGRIAQAGAIAALKDQDWLGHVVDLVAKSRNRIALEARANGLTPVNSATNFVAIDCGRDGPYAKRILDGLISRDIFVRKPAAPVLDRCIRVSCGTDRDMDLFAAALPGAIADANRG